MALSLETQRRFLAILEEVYQQGVADGSAATTQAIINAARNASGTSASLTQTAGATLSATGVVSDRAPRGLLRQVVTKILEEHPGLTITEVTELAPKIDARISDRSVGGEIRRGEGIQYRREGKKWFLNHKFPAPDIGGTTGDEAPAADSVNDLT